MSNRIHYVAAVHALMGALAADAVGEPEEAASLLTDAIAACGKWRQRCRAVSAGRPPTDRTTAMRAVLARDRQGDVDAESEE